MAEFHSPTTLRGISKNIKGRYNALLKALTKEKLILCSLCDSDEAEYCLVGRPDGSWEVQPPLHVIPPSIPEPTMGFNFSRTSLLEECLDRLAEKCYSWLFEVASFYEERSGFYDTVRKQLSSTKSDISPLKEIVSKFEGDGCCQPGQVRGEKKQYLGSKDDEEDKELCEACGMEADANTFWICCNFCPKLFHGDCIRITAANIAMKLKCPSCQRGELYEKKKIQDDWVYNQNVPVQIGVKSQLEFERNVLPCVRCGEDMYSDMFWIICKVCIKLFHGKCLEITPDDNIKKHDCPSCNRRELCDFDEEFPTIVSETTEELDKIELVYENTAEEQVGFCERAQSMGEIQEVFELKRPEDQGESSQGVRENPYLNQLFRFCSFCEKWYPKDSVVVSVGEIMESICLSCNVKKWNTYRPSCEECDTSIYSNEFGVSCRICKKWYHGYCAGVDPSDAPNSYTCAHCYKRKYKRIVQCGICEKACRPDEHYVVCVNCQIRYHSDCVILSNVVPNQYKCPACSNMRSIKRLPCGVCGKIIAPYEFKVICVRCIAQYHGICVYKVNNKTYGNGIYSRRTDRVSRYLCPSCIEMQNAKGS